MKPFLSAAAFVFFVSLLSLQVSCKKGEDGPAGNTDTTTTPLLPAIPFNYAAVSYPEHIRTAIALFDNTPADNPLSDHGATLGRVLFYDKNLSINRNTACASCHKQELGFSDGKIKSLGHGGQATRRNSMTLLNLRCYRSGKMFWDERAASLEAQVLLPIQDQIEMGFNLPALIQRLNGIAYYKPLFQRAFGSESITEDRIAKALAQFLRSIITYRSKWDRVKQGLASFTAEEQAGKELFYRTGRISACLDCHSGGAGFNEFQQGVIPIRNFPSFENAHDLGVFEATGDPADSSRFKLPSLRNVALSAPYMHNGQVSDLNALFNNNYHAFDLSATEKANIIAFLHTLTDQELGTDPRFSDPFAR